MLSAYRRHAVVLALVLVAGLTSIAARPESRQPALPSIASLTAGSDWRVIKANPLVSYTGMTYGEWQLYDNKGFPAQLYAGAASLQKMLHWSGELGYEGAGYQATHRTTTTLRLRDGTTVPVAVAIEQHLTDREYVAYASVGPGYVAARSSDNLPRTAWDVVRGSAGPYYVARVSVPSPTSALDPQAAAAAARLLMPVLSRLSHLANGATVR